MVEADLLVHVMDASSPALAQQRATVLDVLRGCGPASRCADCLRRVAFAVCLTGCGTTSWCMFGVVVGTWALVCT